MKKQFFNDWEETKSVEVYESDMYMNGEVCDGWGISAARVRRAFGELANNTEVNIWMNSPGGNVFEGVAIKNELLKFRQSGHRVNLYVYGLAASIASVIACAADTVYMLRGSMYMIHDPYSMVAGGAEELRKEAAVLDKIKSEIVETYTTRTGKTAEEVAALMAAETYYTPEEAVDAGFADAVLSAADFTGNEEDREGMKYNKVTARRDVEAVRKPQTVRELESKLKLIGYSNAEAKAAAGAVFSALNRRDDDLSDSEMEEVKHALEARNRFTCA